MQEKVLDSVYTRENTTKVKYAMGVRENTLPFEQFLLSLMVGIIMIIIIIIIRKWCPI